MRADEIESLEMGPSSESLARSGEADRGRAIGLAGNSTSPIPASHRDLVECPPVAALTTVMRDGYPQTSVVWCDFDGEFVRVNTMRGFAKERNMRRDPRVTLLCYDPRRPLRYLEVRGTVVEMVAEGAARHLDDLASKYAGRPIHFFGDAIPARFAETESPVLCRIRPTHVVGAIGTGPGARVLTAEVVGGLPMPVTHLDLLSGSTAGVLTTMSVDGHPRSRMVWVNGGGESRPVNTTLGRQDARNLLANPKASLLVVDPDNTSRFIQIRGDAEVVPRAATDPLPGLTNRGTGRAPVHWGVHAVEQQARQARLICRVQARRITLDAIHA